MAYQRVKGTKPGPGPRTKLDDPVRLARMVDAVKIGGSHRIAAQYGGCHEQTFSVWYTNGRNLAAIHDLDPDTLPESERKFLDFYLAIADAEGQFAASALAVIRRSAIKDKNWTAAAWMLERRYPQEFGRTIRETTNLDINVSELSDEELDQIANGENPLTVVARRAALAASSQGRTGTPAQVATPE